MRSQSDVWKFPITGEPSDNAKRGVRITRQTGEVQTLTLSPDESEVAFLSDNDGHVNVWIARVADGEMRPLTRDVDPKVFVAVPFWSPQSNVVNFISNRNTGTADVTLWVVNSDGSDPRDLGVVGAWACWSGDGRWLFYSALEKGIYHIRKVRRRSDRSGCRRASRRCGRMCRRAPDGSMLYYAKVLVQSTGLWDIELRAAAPETGPSVPLGRILGVADSGRPGQHSTVCVARWPMAGAAARGRPDRQPVGAFDSNGRVAEADRLRPDERDDRSADCLGARRTFTLRVGVPVGVGYRPPRGSRLVD